MSQRGRVIAVVDIEVSDVERFVAAAAKCAEATLSEPGTLVYDYFINKETGRARLIEVYESAEAYDAHVYGPVFMGVGAPMMETCSFVNVELFGDVDKDAPGPQMVIRLWPHTQVWGVPFTSGSNP